MAAKKKFNIDKRNIIIIFLLVIICGQTYLLYNANPQQFMDFFIHQDSATKSKTQRAKTVFTPAEKIKTSVNIDKIQKPLATAPTTVSSTGIARVAFIIDDWGYSTKNCQYLKNIAHPIAVAVLPDLPHSVDVMQCAHEAGKEIMLHLPMEPHDNKDPYPTDYILKTTMTPIKIDNLLSKILDKMPLVEGVNNHMGSKATENKMLMTTVLKQLKHRGLFFVDSRVTAKSVCAPLAKQIGVPFTSRDIFLDNVNERVAITNQLVALVRLAKKRGSAVAIGHDRSLTLQVIEEKMPWLQEQGIVVVNIKEIVKQ